jgi:hypothetical protein
MSKRVEIKFKRGGTFVAELLERQTPKVCETFWNMLPLKFKMFQSRWGGEELYNNQDIAMDIEMESLTKEGEVASVGEIAYFNGTFRGMKLRAITIYYGEVVLPIRVNKFARITENLEELKKVGEMVWLRGPEEITIRKLA